MGGVFWFLKGLLAIIFTLGNTVGMTPVWLVKAVMLRRQQREEGGPNVLQWYLTFAARAFLWWLAALRTQPAQSTWTPSRLRDSLLCRRFAWIAPAEVGTAKAAFDDGSLPVKLDTRETKRRSAALWYLNPAEAYVKGQLEKATRTSPILLYFHGGAYITLEAGDIFVGLTLARMQAKHAGVDVCSINYRLAPGSKHPSQLYEAYSAWRHLRAIGYTSILLGGDSAGANLALTLWHYLDEVAQESEQVSGLVLHSPWIDMQGHKNASFARNLPTCVITPRYVTTGQTAMQTDGKPATDSVWLSPSVWTEERMRRLPRTLVTNGGAEALLEEGSEFVRRAQAAGVQVDHYVAPNHPHDFGAMFWFYPSIRVMFRYAGKWIKKDVA